MTTILNGLLGGLVATTATELLARVVGAVSKTAESEESDDERAGKHRLQSTAIRLAYGSTAGGTLVALELYVLGVLAVPPGWGEALLVGVGWSLLLFVACSLWTRFVSGRRPKRAYSPVGTLALHLAFGVALGLWIRLTWIT